MQTVVIGAVVLLVLAFMCLSLAMSKALGEASIQLERIAILMIVLAKACLCFSIK